jgi:hypothetical protein
VDAELLVAHEREKNEIREQMENKFKKEIEEAQQLAKSSPETSKMA